MVRNSLHDCHISATCTPLRKSCSTPLIESLTINWSKSPQEKASQDSHVLTLKYPTKGTSNICMQTFIYGFIDELDDWWLCCPLAYTTHLPILTIYRSLMPFVSQCLRTSVAETISQELKTQDIKLNNQNVDISTTYLSDPVDDRWRYCIGDTELLHFYGQLPRELFTCLWSISEKKLHSSDLSA